MEDAEKVSDLILRSLRGEEVDFNPFQGRIFQCNDGTIKFMGDEVKAEDALRHIAAHIWKNRKKVNKQIKKWKIAGPDLINCGC